VNVRFLEWSPSAQTGYPAADRMLRRSPSERSFVHHAAFSGVRRPQRGPCSRSWPCSQCPIPAQIGWLFTRLSVRAINRGDHFQALAACASTIRNCSESGLITSKVLKCSAVALAWLPVIRIVIIVSHLATLISPSELLFGR
jgi:hypothetical protein